MQSQSKNPHLTRFEYLASERKTIEQTWDNIEQYISPYRGRFFQQDTNEEQVEWRKRGIFDSTALMAAQTLAANMHGNLTSPSMRWFDMQYNSEKLRDDNAAARWLEESATETYNHIQSSNFNLEVSELYTDLVSFGTGSMVEEEMTNSDGDFVSLGFTAPPIKEVFFEDDWTGQPIRYYRLLNWSASRLVSRFGMDKVPERVQQAFEKGDTTMFEVVFCVWRKDNSSTAPMIDPFTVRQPQDRPYGFNYYMRNSGEALQEEGGYYEMPAFMPRWRTSSGSRWGNSPAMIALPDVMTLNELIRMVLRANEKVVDPAIMVEERALLGDLDLSAGGLNVIRRLSAIAPFESKARFDVSPLQVQDLRNSINRIFYIDQLQLKESPVMTATEVQVRYEMMQRTLGPTLGRLQTDFLNKVVERSFNILYRAGRLPDPPSIVIDSGVEASINYIGPLARSQRIDASAAIERFTTQLMGLIQIDPQVRHVPDFTEMVIAAAENLNVPAKLIRSRQDIANAVAQEQQAMQEAQEAQLMEQGAKTDALAAKAEAQRNGRAAGG